MSKMARPNPTRTMMSMMGMSMTVMMKTPTKTAMISAYTNFESCQFSAYRAWFLTYGSSVASSMMSGPINDVKYPMMCVSTGRVLSCFFLTYYALRSSVFNSYSSLRAAEPLHALAYVLHHAVICLYCGLLTNMFKYVLSHSVLMVSPEALAWVRNALKKQHSHQVILDALLKQGYAEDQAKELIVQAQASEVPSSDSSAVGTASDVGSPAASTPAPLESSVPSSEPADASTPSAVATPSAVESAVPSSESAVSPSPAVNTPPAAESSKTSPKRIILVVALAVFFVGVAVSVMLFMPTQEDAAVVLEDDAVEDVLDVDFEVSELTPGVFEPTCDNLPAYLEACVPYSCEFIHPLTGTPFERSILGFDAEGLCGFVEQMPGNGTMECLYDDLLRRDVAQMHYDMLREQDPSFSLELEFVGVENRTGRNPLEAALSDGHCQILGFDF